MAAHFLQVKKHRGRRGATVFGAALHNMESTGLAAQLWTGAVRRVRTLHIQWARKRDLGWKTGSVHGRFMIQKIHGVGCHKQSQWFRVSFNACRKTNNRLLCASMHQSKLVPVACKEYKRVNRRSGKDGVQHILFCPGQQQLSPHKHLGNTPWNPMLLHVKHNGDSKAQ
jgi:hypothetical protein